MPRKAAPWFRKSTGRWYVTFNGKQTALPVTDPSDQSAAWDAFRALVARANSSPVGRPEPVAELIAEYLDSIAHRVNERTRNSYKSYLRRFAALFGNSAVNALDAATIERAALQEGWSDSTRANYLLSVQSFVRWAGRPDFAIRRPAKESRGAEAVISEETHRLVLRETTGDFHEYCRFLWAVGCRPMEAARLLVVNVDFASGTATLRQHKMKHKGQARVLYLSSEALSIARGQVEKYEAGHLFRGLGGKPLTLHAIVCRFLRISAKLGRSVRAYDYRHTWATRALLAGVPDTHVAAMLGHRSTQMLHLHYSHVGQNAVILREAADRVK